MSLYNSHSFLLRNSLITSRNEGLRNMCDWFYYLKLLSFAHHEHFDTRKRTSQRTRSEQGRTEPRVDSACGPRSCLKGQKITVFTKCPGRADPEDSRFIGGASHERHGRTVRTPRGHQLPTASWHETHAATNLSPHAPPPPHTPTANPGDIYLLRLRTLLQLDVARARERRPALRLWHETSKWIHARHKLQQIVGIRQGRLIRTASVVVNVSASHLGVPWSIST